MCGRPSGSTRTAALARLDRGRRSSRVVVLLAVALAQPVIREPRDADGTSGTTPRRSTSSTSRGRCWPRPEPDEPTRLERAQRVALRMRGRLTELPSGVATLTDRVLPNLFPTADEEVFTATVEQSVGVDRPASRALDEVTTLFAAFDTMAGDNFFGVGRDRTASWSCSRTGSRRSVRLVAAARRSAEGPPLKFVVVVVWDDERARVVRRQGDPELPAGPEPRPERRGSSQRRPTVAVFDESAARRGGAQRRGRPPGRLAPGGRHRARGRSARPVVRPRRRRPARDSALAAELSL